MTFILLSHCGLYVGDTYEDVTLSGTNLSCLDDINQKFENYLKKRIPHKEIGQVSQCLQSAVHIFKNHVWGKEVDTYSSEELRIFLQEFLLKEKQISDELLKSLMDLKVGLVGGSPKLLTFAELDQISERIGLLGKFVSDVYPYIDVLYNSNEFQTKDLQKGILGFRDSLKQLSHNIFAHPYSLNSGLKLLEQSNEIFQFSKNQDFIWFKFFKNTVPFMLNTPYSKDFIKAHEWGSLLDMTADIISIYLHKIRGDQSQEVKDKVQNYSMVLESSFVFLEKKISSAHKKSLDVKELVEFSQSLDSDGILPQGVSLTYIQKFLEHLFKKIIENPGEQDFSLGLQELRWWRERYLSWKKTQDSIDEFKFWIENNKPYSIQDILENNQIVNQQSFYSSLDTIKYFYNMKPLYGENSFGYFNIHYTYPSTEPLGFRYNNLTFNNFYFYLVSLIIKRYAVQYPEIGLTEQEFGELIKDYVILSSFIKGEEPYIDSTKQYGRAEFIMSNILLYSTEGYYKGDYVTDEIENEKIDLLSLKEGIELLPVYLQVKRSANDVFNFLSQKCSPITLFCVEKNILSYIQKKMSYAPHLKNFVFNLDSPNLKKYTKFLIQTVELSNPVEKIETKNFEFLFYTVFFQEIMMTRFDQNEDGVVDHEEAMGKTFLLWDGLVSYGKDYVMCPSKDESDESADNTFPYFYVINNLELMDTQSWWGRTRIILDYALYMLGNKTQLTRMEVMELAVNLSKRVASDGILSSHCPE